MGEGGVRDSMDEEFSGEKYTAYIEYKSEIYTSIIT